MLWRLRWVLAGDCDDWLQWLLTPNCHHYCTVAELWLAIATIDCSVFLTGPSLFVPYLSYLNTITMIVYNVVHKLPWSWKSLWSRLCITAWRNFYLVFDNCNQTWPCWRCEYSWKLCQIESLIACNLPNNFFLFSMQCNKSHTYTKVPHFIDSERFQKFMAALV